MQLQNPIETDNEPLKRTLIATPLEELHQILKMKKKKNKLIQISIHAQNVCKSEPYHKKCTFHLI